ncbi:DUF1152 domain-containing protein [Enhygromyxa salina]|uniref:DUF1152 domain-containing protein n=1 Tax=Enhygromyxa salina TaxID=215803 RepID=A0A2S9YMK0_9BACT|nr:DUF1152 domain-containing protein [Enhygromyxa salina]PRQ06307.1 hypothetical protein ENSA7_39840 [Enhygromyxa salina]
MQLDAMPFFDRLRDCKRVLLAGAGGGFDIFCGLPLYFALRRRGCEVHLANLSFSRLPLRDDDPCPVYKVEPTTEGSPHYFPERCLSEWFASELGEDVPIWSFAKSGVQPLRRAYELVLAQTRADAIVLIDGGTDSLMRGDECGLGTPAEDMSTIAAVHGIDSALAPTRLLVSVGFGVDSFHGVAHVDVLEAIAAIDQAGGYLGVFPLLRGMPEVERYREACEYVCAATPTRPSIVNLSILSAIDGEFGDHHRTARTRGSELFINPLMNLMFAFELGPLAQRVLYLDALEQTQTIYEISAVLERVRGAKGGRPRRSIPI